MPVRSKPRIFGNLNTKEDIFNFKIDNLKMEDTRNQETPEQEKDKERQKEVAMKKLALALKIREQLKGKK